jgi:ADP-dependent NAD(P)H-hydrate dehydratase / NAD(P)H-hydrate epimerase
MVKILNAQQIRDLDKYTIENEPISSIDLMERASREFVLWFVQRFDGTKKIGIVCGTGNNGGDGLAIARMLLDWNYLVSVWIVKGEVRESEDFKINLERLKPKLEILEIGSEADQNLFQNCDVLIDAIFGSGLSRSTEGIYAQAIRCINKTNAIVVAVDMPSGLQADAPSSGDIVEADYTATFQLPKLSLFFPESFRYSGEFKVLDIGLSKAKIKSEESKYFQVTAKACRKILKPRKKFDHKGSYGHALLIAGSFGKMGAAVLSTRAALRAGAGLVSAHIPKCGYSILQSSVPEAMASVDHGDDSFSNVDDLEKFSTIGIGPGLGQAKESADGLKKVFEVFRKPVVLDADALNIIASNEKMRTMIPESSILTPHPKEFERLVGKWDNDFEKIAMQKKLAAELNSIILLKGAFTTIAEPNGVVYFNPTGNPGMASGGTGDVLTGILTGLMAQFYSPIQTAILGTFLHGLAGDLAAVEKGKDSLLASDLVEFLPRAFKNILGE